MLFDGVIPACRQPFSAVVESVPRSGSGCAVSSGLTQALSPASRSPRRGLGSFSHVSSAKGIGTEPRLLLTRVLSSVSPGLGCSPFISLRQVCTAWFSTVWYGTVAKSCGRRRALSLPHIGVSCPVVHPALVISAEYKS